MFLSVYKTTLKNLFRSLLFWLIFAFLIGVSLYNTMSVNHGDYSSEYKEMIWDTDPRYVLSEQTYVENVMNNCTSIMLYAMPLIAIVSTFLILSRDYGDGFYEIERSGGRRPLHYLTGRLAALLTVNFLAILFTVFLMSATYVFTRGGVSGMPIGEFWADFIPRVLRNVICVTWAPITMFVCFTYMQGSLFKNGWVAAIGSSAFVLINYVFNYQLRFRVPAWYGQYLMPTPDTVQGYFRFYNYYAPEKFEQFLTQKGISLGLALAGIGWVLGVALIYSLASYLRIRCREA